MTSSVQVSSNPEQTRVALRLFHPKGNIITAEIVAALSGALETIARNPHVKLITIEGEGPDYT